MNKPAQKTLLLVEDDKLLQRYLVQFLEPHGFHIMCAATYHEAMLILEVQNVDLCIMDLALPDRSGLELLHAIRQDPRHATLPVIVESGFGDKMVKEVLAYDPVRLFQKPFPLQELLQTVQDALGTARKP